MAERIIAAERSTHRVHAAARRRASKAGSVSGQRSGLPNACQELTPYVLTGMQNELGVSTFQGGLFAAAAR